MTVMLRHNRIDLALHRLRDGSGRPLLVLHGLGERSPERVPEHLAGWPGPVWATCSSLTATTSSPATCSGSHSLMRPTLLIPFPNR